MSDPNFEVGTQWEARCCLINIFNRMAGDICCPPLVADDHVDPLASNSVVAADESFSHVFELAPLLPSEGIL